MSEIDNFVDEFFLEHGARSQAEIREYNRRYYLRTRKLKGRSNFGKKSGNRSTSRPKKIKNKAVEKRFNDALAKLIKAHKAAKSLPPAKRVEVQRRIDAATRKLLSERAKYLNKHEGGSYNV